MISMSSGICVSGRRERRGFFGSEIFRRLVTGGKCWGKPGRIRGTQTTRAGYFAAAKCWRKMRACFGFGDVSPKYVFVPNKIIGARIRIWFCRRPTTRSRIRKAQHRPVVRDYGATRSRADLARVPRVLVNSRPSGRIYSRNGHPAVCFSFVFVATGRDKPPHEDLAAFLVDMEELQKTSLGFRGVTTSLLYALIIVIADRP
jgi:hypothetical protein